MSMGFGALGDIVENLPLNKPAKVMLDYKETQEQWPFTWVYKYNIPLATGQIRHQPFAITDADFIARAYMLDTSASMTDFLGVGPFTSKQFSLAISRPDESLIHTKQVIMGPSVIGQAAVNMNLNQGTAQFPIPIIPELYLKRYSNLYIDATNLDVADIAIELAVQGVKLFPRHTHYSPPAGTYEILPFRYHFRLQQVPGGLITATTFPSIRLQLDADAEFCLYSIDCGNLSGLQIKVYGSTREEPLSNDLIGLSNYCGSARYPAALCAPVFFPAGGQIKFDFRIPTGLVVATIDNPSYITFRGMKMYRRSVAR